MYDVLYSLVPLSQAMCSKDDSGKYCVMDIASTGTNSSGTNNGASSSGSGTFSTISQYLWNSASSATSSVSKRDSSQIPISIVPNATTFNDNNVLFLFLSPNLTSSELCTACARNVLTSYITFESNVPYAPGMSASTLMKGQSTLYSAVESTCGSSFLTGAAQAAGGLSGGLLGSAAPGTVVSSVAAAGAVIGAGLLAVVAMF